MFVISVVAVVVAVVVVGFVAVIVDVLFVVVVAAVVNVETSIQVPHGRGSVSIGG